MFGKKKRKKVRIPVSEYEYYLILDSLLSFRAKLIAQGRYGFDAKQMEQLGELLLDRNKDMWDALLLQQ